jgi:hypothetical protein
MSAAASALEDDTFGFAASLQAFARGAVRAGEVACAFVVEHLHARSGRRLLQAPRPKPLACDAAHPCARLIAERNLRCLPETAARALVAWASDARDVDLLRRVPHPRHVLALQAKRRRCVSLLDEGAGDPLAFALHDLEHLEKFVDPEHHEGQVGFFASTAAALDHPRWRDVERGLDARWAADRDHVLADMNGSAAFLFVALKSRLKLAVMRREGVGRDAGDARADAAFDEARQALLDAYALAGPARDAARAFASRHDDPSLGETLVRAFVARA